MRIVCVSNFKTNGRKVARRPRLHFCLGRAIDAADIHTLIEGQMPGLVLGKLP
jgi:hypothetical protein